MSVEEHFAIDIESAEQGLLVGDRLATRIGARLRWAAVWTGDDHALRSALATELGARLLPSADGPDAPLLVASANLTDVGHLIARLPDLDRHGKAPVRVHWSVAFYESEEGPRSSPWISFEDPWGQRREDAKVYEVELAGHAVPFSGGSRPWDQDFVWGPTPSTGWALRTSAIRDHMPQPALRAWLAEAAGVRPDSVRQHVFVRDV